MHATPEIVEAVLADRPEPPDPSPQPTQEPRNDVPGPVAAPEPVQGDTAPVGQSLELVDDLPLIPGADEFRSLAMQAKMLAGSALVPQALRDRPADVLLVLLTGRDLGISPTAALRKCYVVDGQVTVAPALKIALVRAKGLGAVRPAPGNDATQATAIAYGPDGVEWGRATFTIEDAERITSKGKRLTDGANWKNYPHRMLWWRVATQVVDDYFPEVAFGLYTPEELGAITGEDGEVLDVDGVEVVPGFEPQIPPGQSTIDADALAHVKGLANGLPAAARVALKDLLVRAHLPRTFDTSMTKSQYGKVCSLIRGVERDVARGVYPPDEPADTPADPQGVEESGDGDDIEDAVVVDDNGDPIDQDDAAPLGRLEQDPEGWEDYDTSPFE